MKKSATKYIANICNDKLLENACISLIKLSFKFDRHLSIMDWNSKKVPELGSLAGWLKIRSFKGDCRMEKSCKTLIFCLIEPIYLLHRAPFPYLYWLCGSVPIWCCLSVGFHIFEWLFLVDLFYGQNHLLNTLFE